MLGHLGLDVFANVFHSINLYFSSFIVFIR